MLIASRRNSFWFFLNQFKLFISEIIGNRQYILDNNLLFVFIFCPFHLFEDMKLRGFRCLTKSGFSCSSKAMVNIALQDLLFLFGPSSKYIQK